MQERPVRRIKEKGGGSEREEEEEGAQKGQRGGNRHKKDDETQGNKHGRKGEQGAHRVSGSNPVESFPLLIFCFNISW